MIAARTIAPRDPREREPKYLAYLRGLACVSCGKAAPCDAAHIRMSSERHVKRDVGAGEKPHDRFAVPLCRRCHRKQHSMSERGFWFTKRLNPLDIAAALYRAFKANVVSAPTTAKPKSRRKIPQRSNVWPKGQKMPSGRKLQSRNNLTKQARAR